MMERCECDVVVVGAGPAGLSAATAVDASREVIVLDDNPAPGGQIWRSDRGKLSAESESIVAELSRRRNVLIRSGVQAFSSEGKALMCESEKGLIRIAFDKLIIATGARELFLPFPGWTLPNVFGAGGLQALVKGGFDVSGKRIAVSGTGPLLLAVAAYLRSKGAEIVLVAEQAPLSRLMKFGLGLWRMPSKLIQGAGLMRGLAGTRIAFGSFVERAGGETRVESVTIRLGDRRESVVCDMLACGYHLVGNTELAELAGCRVENGKVVVDETQTTTVRDVFCAGEPTGIGGLELSVVEGAIAGSAASGIDDIGRLLRRKRALQRIADSMNRCYGLREELRTLAEADTIVCRCEDATYGEMSEYADFRSAKLRTRCGMGACRGRVCGTAARFVFGWGHDSARPPIFPVRAGTLADIDLESYE